MFCYIPIMDSIYGAHSITINFMILNIWHFKLTASCHSYEVNGNDAAKYEEQLWIVSKIAVSLWLSIICISFVERVENWLYRSFRQPIMR